MDCFAYCTASAYQIKALQESLKSRFTTTLFREVLHVRILEGKNVGDVYYFPYGCLVTWGLSKEKSLEMINYVNQLDRHPLDDIESDEFSVSYGEKTHIEETTIVLESDDVLIKLALSHGISQSVKLGSFEEITRKTFNTTRHIPEELGKRGKVPLSRSEIRRKMRELFTVRSSIILHVDCFDTPEFIWEHDELEPFYRMIATHLDLETRVLVLNQRLQIIHELFQMLGNELNHQHSSRLEWTIIWLILIEVVLVLLRDVFEII
ncbi:MAG: RMD1 family protein [Chlamydiia bacterium]|nr:RMD1 family protein [Chlamydiia bacterium]